MKKMIVLLVALVVTGVGRASASSVLYDITFIRRKMAHCCRLPDHLTTMLRWRTPSPTSWWYGTTGPLI